MYNPYQYSKKRPVMFLYLLIVINGILIFLAGLFLPPLVGLIGLFFGFHLYYLSYTVPAKSTFWREARLFIIAITGVTLGVFLLWLSCGYIKIAVCTSVNQLQAQFFISYAFTLPFLLLSWIIYRLPMLIDGIRKEKE